jgi:hypothetical protein
MKRLGILFAFAVCGGAMGTSGPASAAEVSCWYNGALHSCVWYPGYTYSYEYPYDFGLGTLAPGYTYAYNYPYDFGLGALVTAPVALASDATAPLVTGRSAAVAPLMTGRSVAVETVPLMTGRSAAVGTVAVTGVAGSGNYCATSVKTCLLNEPGWLGTGCSCRVHGGRARGFVQ